MALIPMFAIEIATSQSKSPCSLKETHCKGLLTRSGFYLLFIQIEQKIHHVQAAF